MRQISGAGGCSVALVIVFAGSAPVWHRACMFNESPDEFLAKWIEESMVMDTGRLILIALWALVAVACQSTPPSQHEAPPEPPPESERSQGDQDRNSDRDTPSQESFDGLEEADEPVVPPESIEQQ